MEGGTIWCRGKCYRDRACPADWPHLPRWNRCVCESISRLLDQWPRPLATCCSPGSPKDHLCRCVFMYGILIPLQMDGVGGGRKDLIPEGSSACQWHPGLSPTVGMESPGTERLPLEVTCSVPLPIITSPSSHCPPPQLTAC